MLFFLMNGKSEKAEASEIAIIFSSQRQSDQAQFRYDLFRS